MNLKGYAAIWSGLIGATSGVLVLGVAAFLFHETSRSDFEIWASALTYQASSLAGQAAAEHDDLALVNRFERLLSQPAVKSIMLVDPQGTIRWHADPQREGKPVVLSLAGEAGSRWRRDSNPATLECWAPVFQREAHTGTVLLIFTSQFLVEADRRFLSLGLLGVLLAGLASGFVGWRVWREPSRRLSRLREAQHQLLEGLPPVWPDGLAPLREVRRLEEILHLCADQWKEGRAHLVQAQGSLQNLPGETLSRLSPLLPSEGWALFNPQNRLISCGPRAKEMFGVEMTTGHHLLDLLKDEALHRLFQEANAAPGTLRHISWHTGEMKALALPVGEGTGAFTLLAVVQ